FRGRCSCGVGCKGGGSFSNASVDRVTEIRASIHVEGVGSLIGLVGTGNRCSSRLRAFTAAWLACAACSETVVVGVLRESKPAAPDSSHDSGAAGSRAPGAEPGPTGDAGASGSSAWIGTSGSGGAASAAGAGGAGGGGGTYRPASLGDVGIEGGTRD